MPSEYRADYRANCSPLLDRVRVVGLGHLASARRRQRTHTLLPRVWSLHRSALEFRLPAADAARCSLNTHQDSARRRDPK